MQAVLWSDYLCPWCYLGTHRTAVLRELGVRVTQLPYELHPEVPPTGRRVSTAGRLAAVFARVGAECEAVGLPFAAPTLVPNTLAALESAELVRRHHPDAFAPLDASLFRAVFADGRDLGDDAVLAELVAAAGVDPDEITARRRAAEGAAALEEARDAAFDAGVTATPAWLLDGRLLVPGVQPPETLSRWVERLRARPPS